MKIVNVLLVLFLFISISIKAQPTGEQKMAKVKIHFLDKKKDTITFYKVADTFVSKNKKGYRLSIVSQNYSIDLKDLEAYNKNFMQLQSKDSTVTYHWKEKLILDKVTPFDELNLIDEKLFSFLYFPAIQKVGTDEITPSKDIILHFAKEECKMKVLLKLYNSKSEFETVAYTNIYIPFKKGNYEITDPINPKLIAVMD